MIQALERSGRIDKDGKLQLDNPLTVTDKQVKVIVLINEEDDLPEHQWHQATKNNQAFDFLDNPAEDIYSVSDGEAFYDEI